jgi:hypothetical protein
VSEVVEVLPSLLAVLSLSVRMCLLSSAWRRSELIVE